MHKQLYNGKVHQVFLFARKGHPEVISIFFPFYLSNLLYRLYIILSLGCCLIVVYPRSLISYNLSTNMNIYLKTVEPSDSLWSTYTSIKGK